MAGWSGTESVYQSPYSIVSPKTTGSEKPCVPPSWKAYVSAIEWASGRGRPVFGWWYNGESFTKTV